MASAVPVTEQARLYKASARKPEILHVPEMAFVMIDGHGDPYNSLDYKHAIEALYALSYTLKFTLKQEHGPAQYRVGPLEGLWWAEDMAAFSIDKEGWDWTMMIVQSDAVTPERFELARKEVGRKQRLPALAKAQLERFEEGSCAQIMHVGPFDTEGPTIARLHAFISEHGYTFDGRWQKHHEIYLSDPRRSPPEKWRTIIRQPFSTA